MKHIKILICIVLLFAPLAWSQRIVLPVPGGPTTVENFVSQVAIMSRSSGSLEVSGTCVEGEPATRIDHPPRGPFPSTSSALADLTRIDKRLTWHRNSHGVFSVRDAGLSDGILSVRFGAFRIRTAAGPSDAIDQLLNAPAIRKAFKKEDAQRVYIPNPMGGSVPKSLPRLSLNVDGLTLREALNRVISFYPGWWLYSECRIGTERRITIRGVPVAWPRERK